LSNLRLPWLSLLYWIYIFYHSGFLSNLRFPRKTEFPRNFSLYWVCFYIQDFRATCACPEKQSLLWEFSLYWIYFFTTHDFWATWDCPEKQSLPWIFSLYWNIFYHSGFLSNSRVPWKQSFPENFHGIEHTVYIIKGFWATCTWPKEQSRPETFTVLNVYFLSFRIFEQLALALKTEFALHFHCIRFFFKENVRYPVLICRDSISLILGTRIGSLKPLKKTWCIEHIFFIIQDFWATCACPENRVDLKIFAVLNIYFLSVRIFEKLAHALQTEFALNSLYWIYKFLSFKIFEQLALALEDRGGAAVFPAPYAYGYRHLSEIFFPKT